MQPHFSSFGHEYRASIMQTTIEVLVDGKHVMELHGAIPSDCSGAGGASRTCAGRGGLDYPTKPVGGSSCPFAAGAASTGPSAVAADLSMAGPSAPAAIHRRESARCRARTWNRGWWCGPPPDGYTLLAVGATNTINVTLREARPSISSGHRAGRQQSWTVRPFVMEVERRSFCRFARSEFISTSKPTSPGPP